MPERLWYRSLYWRIAMGFIALLAVLLVVQTVLFVTLTNRMWGGASRTPVQLAELVAQDLSLQLSDDPQFNVDDYLRHRYALGYQPFVVVLKGDERSLSNRPTAIPPNLPINARSRLAGRQPEMVLLRNGQRTHFAEYAEIFIDGVPSGIVAVPRFPPPLTVGLREVAPTLAWVGVALFTAGAAVMALLIFRPSHRRLRSLEDAARALGDGRTDVRANESGGDEVSALSRTFNKMADDLQARATALAEADRVRRQLLADVSHELMTPLAAIRGYVETLGMRELRLDQPTRERYLAIAHEETHKLEAIIGDLLDLARLEGGGDTLEFDAVLADDLFRRVADRHRPTLINSGITLTSDAAEDTPLIWGDADRLEQALQNVAANAIRHTPQGGTVSLRASRAGEGVRLTVSDTGPGIPPDHLPHIFDRFYKVDASRADPRRMSGSGLGLSIVRAIVIRHGGQITAFNGENGGAVFEILLPGVERSGRHAVHVA
jgi:signal transduction histidine kinase